jgi:o-succinylbenzoate---CoA ligase
MHFVVEDFYKEWHRGNTEFVRHTSGSTGAPKAIVLSRAQMQASAQLTHDALQLRAGQTALVCLNVNFIAGTMMLVRCWEIGMTPLVVSPTSNPLREVGADAKIDFAAFVPLQLQTMLEANLHERLNAMQVIIVGGAAVSERLETQLQALTVPVFATYGMTETVSHVALKLLNTANKQLDFQLLPNIEHNTDERGCLRVRGAVSNHEWVQTNDLVTFTGEGCFRLEGRADNIINSGGVKIQLEKVERAVEQMSGELGLSERFFCWAQPDERLGQQLVLLVESPVTDAWSLDKIKNTLSPLLTAYEIPKAVLFVEKFSETATGKLDKRHTFAEVKGMNHSLSDKRTYEDN